jgi:hypothetical protein
VCALLLDHDHICVGVIAEHNTVDLLQQHRIESRAAATLQSND